jgi:hypothetical protein
MTPTVKFKTYEIHYVHYGRKKVARQRAARMTDAQAWWVAAVEAGVPASVLPSLSMFSLLVITAENQGVSKVRWNVTS